MLMDFTYLALLHFLVTGLAGPVDYENPKAGYLHRLDRMFGVSTVPKRAAAGIRQHMTKIRSSQQPVSKS